MLPRPFTERLPILKLDPAPPKGGLAQMRLPPLSNRASAIELVPVLVRAPLPKLIVPLNTTASMSEPSSPRRKLDAFTAAVGSPRSLAQMQLPAPLVFTSAMPPAAGTASELPQP